MNYNNQQKQQFFNERNIKINQPKIRTKNFN